VNLGHAFPERSRELLARAQAAIYARERALVGVVLGVLALFFLLRGSLGTLG